MDFHQKGDILHMKNLLVRISFGFFVAPEEFCTNSFCDKEVDLLFAFNNPSSIDKYVLKRKVGFKYKYNLKSSTFPL